MNLNFDAPHIIYACDKCCTKLSRKGERCWRCHSGKGVQVDLVPKKDDKSGTKVNSDMCMEVSRLPALRSHTSTLRNLRNEDDRL